MRQSWLRLPPASSYHRPFLLLRISRLRQIYPFFISYSYTSVSKKKEAHFYFLRLHCRLASTWHSRFSKLSQSSSQLRHFTYISSVQALSVCEMICSAAPFHSFWKWARCPFQETQSLAYFFSSLCVEFVSVINNSGSESHTLRSWEKKNPKQRHPRFQLRRYQTALENTTPDEEPVLRASLLFCSSLRPPCMGRGRWNDRV